MVPLEILPSREDAGPKVLFQGYNSTGKTVEILAEGTSLFTGRVGINTSTVDATAGLNVGGNLIIGSGSNTATIAGPETIFIDPAIVGDNTGVVRIKGDLFVEGTTTQINSTDLNFADFVIGIASTASTDLLADGAGIRIGPDNTFLYDHSNTSLISSENLNLASGKTYKINGTDVLSATSLGSNVTSSSLTSVGTINSGTWQGNVINATYIQDKFLKNDTADDFSGTLRGNNVGGTYFNLRGGGSGDTKILRVSAAENNEDISSNNNADFGFNIRYRGDLSSNENALQIDADNQAGTSVESLRIKQDGIVYFNLTPKVGGNDVLTTADESTLSVSDADTVDGIQADSFLRSDDDDTCSGEITFSSGIKVSGEFSGDTQSSESCSSGKQPINYL